MGEPKKEPMKDLVELEAVLTPRSLAAKLLKASKIIGKIEKAKSPTGGVNFAYQGWDAIMPAVRNACIEVGIAVLPSFNLISVEHVERNGKTWHYVYGSLSLTVADQDSDATYTVTSVGESQGVDDKGVQKAYTSALKYAYLKLFQIPTVDDAKDDPDGIEHEPVPPKEKAVATDAETVKRYKEIVTLLEPSRTWLNAFIAKHNSPKGKYGELMVKCWDDHNCRTTDEIDDLVATGAIA